MATMHSNRSLTACALASVLLCVGRAATAQAAGPLDSLALGPQDTCSAAKKREQELNAEVSQQPNTPIVSAKRAFRGDPAHLIYFCQTNDRIVRRQVFLRFADSATAEDALNRHVSALTEELGRPCATFAKLSLDSTDIDLKEIFDLSGKERTVVWNISADYNAIVFFFPGTSSEPWQIQLLFNSLPDTRLSEQSQNAWRAHGCTLPTPQQPDPNSGQFTLFIP